MTEPGPNGALKPTDLARARDYLASPQSNSVATSNAWIAALLDDIEHRGIDELRRQQAHANDDHVDARATAVQFLESAGESDTPDQAQAVSTGAQAWATLALVDELRAIREVLSQPHPVVKLRAPALPMTQADREDFADYLSSRTYSPPESWARLDPDDGRRWKWHANSSEWELMNRRTDGGEDGDPFSSPNWLAAQGTVVRIPSPSDLNESADRMFGGQ